MPKNCNIVSYPPRQNLLTIATNYVGSDPYRPNELDISTLTLVLTPGKTQIELPVTHWISSNFPILRTGPRKDLLHHSSTSHPVPLAH